MENQLKFDENGNITEEHTEVVDHPTHYNRSNAVECIDEMVAIFGKTAVKHFCLLNVWKYRYRAAEKNGLEDLKKSDWYMQQYLKLGGKAVGV